MLTDGAVAVAAAFGAVAGGRAKAPAQKLPAADLAEPAPALGELRAPCRGSCVIVKHVDDFRPVHNLESLAGLTAAPARIGPAARRASRGKAWRKGLAGAD